MRYVLKYSFNGAPLPGEERQREGKEEDDKKIEEQIKRRRVNEKEGNKRKRDCTVHGEENKEKVVHVVVECGRSRRGRSAGPTHFSFPESRPANFLGNAGRVQLLHRHSVFGREQRLVVRVQVHR